MSTNLLSRESINSRFQAEMIRKFLSLLDKKKYTKVLEVGCGKGFWSYIGAKTGKFDQVVGCDVFEDLQAKEIKKYVSKITYQDLDESGKFPFGDNEFDLIFLMDVIEHVEDDGKLVRECLRVCKPGGQVIIGTPNYYRLTNLPLLLLGRLKYPRKMGDDSYGEVIHLREYSRRRLVSLVGQLKKKVNARSIEATPCWLGVMQFNIGLNWFPGFLSNICQFWFVKFTKNGKNEK